MANRTGLVEPCLTWLIWLRSQMSPLYKSSMSSEHDILERVPDWVLRKLDPEAQSDPVLLDRIVVCGRQIPDRLRDLRLLLGECRHDARFVPAVNLANAFVWLEHENMCESSRSEFRMELLTYATAFMTRRAETRIYRRLIRDPSSTVRRAVARRVVRARIREVSLPDDLETGDWDQTAWSGHRHQLTRHDQGRRSQERHGVPVIPDVGSLQEFLGTRSRKQLGWLMTATDSEGSTTVRGPYVRFTIAKRDGSDRQICAPRPELRYVQRTILHSILGNLPVHDAAHGFVKGRSIVTNAEPHLGSRIVLKFDLRNFFHTIHWSRVLGLFTSLGYTCGDCRVSTEDDSPAVAVALARLCTYIPEPGNWQNCFTPQGAPTSPAIANLVSRKLDARLSGLADRMDGVYTRYADDLTFSFADPTIHVGRFRWWVDQICHQEGFFVNQRKLRVIRSHRRQRVTGIVVNDCLRVPREQRRKIRAIVHNCRKHGIESQSRGDLGFMSWLHGMASYIHMVHPEEGRELLDAIEELRQSTETP